MATIDKKINYSLYVGDNKMILKYGNPPKIQVLIDNENESLAWISGTKKYKTHSFLFNIAGCTYVLESDYHPNMGITVRLIEVFRQFADLISHENFSQVNRWKQGVNHIAGRDETDVFTYKNTIKGTTICLIATS